jgi:NAD+ kinase
VATSHQTENGVINTVSYVESEKAAYAFIPQTPIRSTDAHLVEFSEAMRSNKANTYWHTVYLCYFANCLI